MKLGLGLPIGPVLLVSDNERATEHVPGLCPGMLLSKTFLGLARYCLARGQSVKLTEA
jgi:hypothetical protein